MKQRTQRRLNVSDTQAEKERERERERERSNDSLVSRDRRWRLQRRRVENYPTPRSSVGPSVVT